MNFSFISVFSSMDKVFVNLFSVAILLLFLLFFVDADDAASVAYAVLSTVCGLCALFCFCSFFLNIGYYLNQLKVNFTLSPQCRFAALLLFLSCKKLRCAASRRVWTDVCA